MIKSRKKKCMSTKKKSSPESIVREIKRKARREYSAEEKIRIVLEGLRGEQSITDLCRIHQSCKTQLVYVFQGLVYGLCNLDILNSNTCLAIILLVVVFLSCSTDHWEMSIEN